MKSLLIYFIILLSLAAYAQDDKNPNVELPDFVITGRDVISVRRVDKIPADILSSVSEEYFKPEIKPDELEISDISNPVGGDLSLIDSVKYHRGFISLESGRYKLPSGELSYTYPFERGLLLGNLNGLNQLEYVDNSDRQFISGELNLNYSLPVDGQFLPGTKFSLGGRHAKNNFKFFGSVLPDLRRTLNIGTLDLGIQNLYMKPFIFDLNFSGDFTYLDDETFAESLFLTDAFLRYNANNFKVSLSGNFQSQSLDTDSLAGISSEFLFLRPYVSLELFGKLNADLGITLSGSEGEQFNSVFAALGFEVADNLVFLSEYSPQAEFITAGKLMRGNYYFNQQNLENIFLKKKNKLKVMLKYEFSKYYQIDGGVEYYKAENLPYYVNPNQSGFFIAAAINATNLNLFLNLIYHLGPYGMFYARLDYLKVEDSSGRKIPYYPDFTTSLNYGYDFGSGLRADISLDYLSDRYADLENISKLKSFFNLGFKLTYMLKEQFLLTLAAENILNTKRFLWEGYQEKPFDIAIGFNFFFD